jgi:hypothetical protein
VAAEYWVHVTEADNGDVHLVDRDTIRTQPNGYKRAWTQGFYEKPDAVGTTRYMAYEEYDCREARTRKLQVTFYKENAPWGIDTNPSLWSYVAPSTVADTLFNFVCFGKLTD